MEQSVKNKDRENWYAWLQLGASAISSGKFEEARKYMDLSLSLCDNAWSCYVMACLEYKCLNSDAALKWIIRSVENNHSDVSLVRANFKVLFDLKANGTMISLYGILDGNAKTDGRILLYLTNAYLNEKQYDKAGEIFEKYSDEMMINVHEGEILFTDMWIKYQKSLSGENADINVPQKFEFRMSI